MADDRIARLLTDPTMSDASPYPVLPGQAYAGGMPSPSPPPLDPRAAIYLQALRDGRITVKEYRGFLEALAGLAGR
jgi:hypothetical protein